MTEYIERGAVKRVIESHLTKIATESGSADSPVIEGYLMAKDHVLDFVDIIPAADVVKVVRCEKCKFAEMVVDIIGDPHLFCKERNFREVCFGDFCSHGKRKEQTKCKLLARESKN